MKPKPLPCPICGEKPDTGVSFSNPLQGVYCTLYKEKLQWTDEKLSGRVCHYLIVEATTQAQAIEEWNRLIRSMTGKAADAR